MSKAVKDTWITIKNMRHKKLPSEIVLTKDGNVFVDGELYDETKKKYKGLTVNVEKYGKLNTGEETQKMIAAQKEASKGETTVITDIKDKDKIELTTVKF
ncbi:MAG: hypothetical protein AB1420_07045 [Bacillota bacterium]